jgi:hypothetical protein
VSSENSIGALLQPVCLPSKLLLCRPMSGQK